MQLYPQIVTKQNCDPTERHTGWLGVSFWWIYMLVILYYDVSVSTCTKHTGVVFHKGKYWLRVRAYTLTLRWSEINTYLFRKNKTKFKLLLFLTIINKKIKYVPRYLYLDPVEFLQTPQGETKWIVGETFGLVRIDRWQVKVTCIFDCPMAI